MTDATDSFPLPGDLFQDRYQVERVIGTGGFSRVYLATQTDLGRKVALKIMRPVAQMSDSEEAAGTLATLADRFLQEARVVANLRGPYTVTVHDHGRTDDGHLYMVLEYIDGSSLSSIIKEEGALPAARVAKILHQTLESLQEAHAHGLLHRDIKPANIMVYEHLGKPDNVKVLDFGIAKVVGQEIDTSNHDDLTRSGSLLGTPRYMSPEQLRGDELTDATDIYSLGLVAFEMLMGKKAIESHSSVMIIGAQLDPRSFAVPNVPHIPPRLRMIVNRMLSKDVKERYATAGDILAELSELEIGVAALPPRDRLFTPINEMPDISDSLELLDIEESEFFHQARTVAEEDEEERDNRSVVMWAAVAAAVLAVVVLLVVVVTGGSDGTDQVEPAAANELPEETTVAAVTPEPEAPPKSEQPDETAPAITEIVVSTLPAAAKIYVNGELRGDSPVTLPTADLKFPAKIRAVANSGGERLTIVDKAVSHVEVDLTMMAKAEADPEPEPEARKPKRRTEPVRKVVKRKTDPKPKDSDPEPDTQTNKLTLPALDY